MDTHSHLQVNNKPSMHGQKGIWHGFDLKSSSVVTTHWEASVSLQATQFRERRPLPVWVLGIARRLPRDGVFKHLSSVDLLLHRPTGNQTVDDHVLVLADPEDTVHSLSVRGWIPARVICTQRNQLVPNFPIVQQQSVLQKVVGCRLLPS